MDGRNVPALQGPSSADAATVQLASFVYKYSRKASFAPTSLDPTDSDVFRAGGVVDRLQD
ncbi:unnamed protein product [Parascedosporium putredinis]|uniref:Uncharacterized protein n=1 Tax=Parascedosporium putredinis TaxID=1442378 RepID=A0A9P1HC82_9PEZI|nr:unnamed protein product [Parascedosporium putredinis]CAI8003509.1 unnamed protein product [Parascedosporium putredinis]